MKTIKYFWMLCLAVVAFSFASCKDDDDSQSTPMTIDKVFLEDVKSSVPDREVTFARLGQLIRIQGSGFSGLKKVYINGYDTYFNNALLTDNNIWVTLNGDTPIDKASADVRNKIQLVKDGTSLTYDFIIRAASPSITSVDNTLPKPGELVTVKGTNLQEITKITLPGGVEVTSGITSDEDGEWFTFIMPEGVSEGGSITSEGANGTAVSPEYFNRFDCYIVDFDGKGNLGSWSATYSGDDLVDDPLNTGRGKVAMLIPDKVLAEGPLAAGKRTDFWATAGNDDAADDWNRMTAFIDGSTPVSEVGIQFDIFVDGTWNNTGQLEISLQNNLSTYGYGSADTKPSTEYMHQAGVWVPWLNSDGTTTAFETGRRWVTVTMPFAMFGNYSAEDTSATFLDVINDRNSGSYRNFLMFFVNSDIEFNDEITFPAAATDLKIYVDNLRVVPLASKAVSDFPEE